MFTAMDANGDGAISFDEWLSFSMTNIIAKVNQNTICFPSVAPDCEIVLTEGNDENDEAIKEFIQC